MDKIHNLQESKARFEQNSANISQDLSNRFAEEGIRQYGAADFELMVRGNAQKTNILLNEFLNNNLSLESGKIAEEYSTQKNNHEGYKLEDIHQRNLESLGKSHDDNHMKINQVAPESFEQVVIEKVENNKTEKSVLENLNKLDSQIEQKADQTIAVTKEAEERVSQENSQSTTGKIIDKLNPFKD